MHGHRGIPMSAYVQLMTRNWTSPVLSAVVRDIRDLPPVVECSAMPSRWRTAVVSYLKSVHGVVGARGKSEVWGNEGARRRGEKKSRETPLNIYSFKNCAPKFFSSVHYNWIFK